MGDDALQGSREGLDAFRTALRRLFTGFELIPPGTLGVGSDLGGVIWPQDRDVRAAGYVLVPHVRPEALNLDADQPLSETHAVSLPSTSSAPRSSSRVR
jgi:hypothetical protein